MKPKLGLSIILILPFLVFSCRPGHPVDKKEALNSLKILNRDIISFVHRSSQQPGFKALGFLLKQPSVPLPFSNDTSNGPHIRKDFSFQDNKGIYCWDPDNKIFLKKKDTSIILVRFPMPGHTEEECRFFLYDFEVGKTRTKPEFPVKIKAKLFIGNKQELSFNYQSGISEAMISRMSLELTSNSTELSFSMNREGSFAVKSGTLSYSLLLVENGREILRSDLNIDINYHPPISYSVQYIRIKQEMFSTELSGTIDYGSINPTSNEYDQEFNKNSSLQLLDRDIHGIIGNIVLSPAGENGRFDYFIRFSDGSEGRLTDQLIVLRKLLNYLK